MALPEFTELPFNARPDLTPYLIHLTKTSPGVEDGSAFENLVNILKTGKVWGSKPGQAPGYIKGPNKAACFMDVPFQALKYVLTPGNTDPQNPRYEPYGIAFTKKWAYDAGCRPVLYLANEEVEALEIPAEEQWRVVRFEVTENGWICWLHEREWRCKGTLQLARNMLALVRNTKDVERLSELIEKDRDAFASIPRAILPLHTICQGFLPGV